MAASLVASQKENNPIIRLKLILPYPGYDKAWPEGDRIHFRHILSKADSMEFFSASSSDDCIAKRDRYMIEQSAFCICALYTEDGGLADTLRYARSENLKIINVAK
jgi:uncharacterized phage-like protein YoqJ